MPSSCRSEIELTFAAALTASLDGEPEAEVNVAWTDEIERRA